MYKVYIGYEKECQNAKNTVEFSELFPRTHDRTEPKFI